MPSSWSECEPEDDHITPIIAFTLCKEHKYDRRRSHTLAHTRPDPS